MKTSPLLPASLVSTIALVAAVAVFVQDEQGRLPTSEAAGNSPNISVLGANSELVSKPAPRKSASAPLPLLDTSSPVLVHDRNSDVSDSPASAVSSFKRDTSSPDPRMDWSGDGRESSNEGRGQSARSVPRWVTRPHGAVLLGAAVSAQTSALVSNQNPALENQPTPIATRPATSGQEAARSSFSPATPITPAARPASVPRPETRGRIPWPRGPFTPEEELYRAQFGAAAFSATLREEALGPVEP